MQTSCAEDRSDQFLQKGADLAIDKELYRQALEAYRQWCEDKLIDRARNAEKLSPREGWQQYVDLWEFCMKLCLNQSEWQRKQKLIEDWLAQFAEALKQQEMLVEYRRLVESAKSLQ